MRIADELRCEALKANGQPCGMPKIDGEPFCFAHSPTRAAERAETRRRGGEARAAQRAQAKPAGPILVPLGTIPIRASDASEPTVIRADWWRLETYADIARALAHVAQETLLGRLHPSQANSVSQTLNTLLGAFKNEPVKVESAASIDAKDAIDDILDALSKRTAAETPTKAVDAG